MKSTHLAVIGLLAMALMIPTAKAQNLTYTLVQTVKPTPASYPGVNANILGLRIGMTVSQAEEIAAKIFPGSKPQEFKSVVSINYPGGEASSQSYVSRVDVQYGRFDSLRLYFTNPATENVLYGMTASIDYPDVSKAPLMIAVKAGLIKQYGPSSGLDTWQFGKHSLNKCTLGIGCRIIAIGSGPVYNPGVVLQIYAMLGPSRTDHAKLGGVTMGMQDYQVETESVTAAEKQLKAAATSSYSKMVAAKSKAEQKLKENASNVLDVTGAVTGHALVTGCTAGGDGLNATTFSSADDSRLKFDTMSDPKQIRNKLFQKYELGPVTYDGKKYNMSVEAFGKPPGTTNADVELDAVKGQERAISGNTLVKGSITIADSGSSRAVTFDHAVLKLSGIKGMPPSATVTINGKAYCQGGGGQPLPPDLIAPTQALTGTYAYASTKGTKLTASLDFVSGTVVEGKFPIGKMRGTYQFDGQILRINSNQPSMFLTMDSNGCLDGPNNLIFCKSTAQKLAATKATEARREEEKATAIAAQKRNAALKLVPTF
ncbi:MAG: hypothetical protein EPN46_03020 [Candidimonas sp.]|nr:MAG: hypothetical protein EPN46_03020 [Candidimonas sp.]